MYVLRHILLSLKPEIRDNNRVFIARSTLTFIRVNIQGVQKVTRPMAYFESVFPGRLISKRLWPPRSPDLSPPDFFLWGGISRILCIQIIHTHTLLRASDQHSAHCGQNINWHIAKRVR
jgi:hypothetical protein